MHIGAGQTQCSNRLEGFRSELERARDVARLPVAADQVDGDAEMFLRPTVGPRLAVELLQDVDRVGEPAGRLQRPGPGPPGGADQLGGNVRDLLEQRVDRGQRVGGLTVADGELGVADAELKLLPQLRVVAVQQVVGRAVQRCGEGRDDIGGRPALARLEQRQVAGEQPRAGELGLRPAQLAAALAHPLPEVAASRRVLRGHSGLL